jgi:hypothetical protein
MPVSHIESIGASTQLISLSHAAILGYFFANPASVTPRNGDIF